MAKYKTELVELAYDWVCEHGLMEFGGAQLQDFIKVLGVDDKTYRKWMLTHPEFKSAIDKGKAVFKQNLTHQLHTSLAEAAKGGEHEEVTTEYRPNAQNPNQPTITKMVKRKVYVGPNVGAAIFLLTNLDPEHYQNRQRTDVAIKPTQEDEMTIEEINAEIERLEKLDKK